MPWTAKDALKHTKKAITPMSKRAFMHAANSVLKQIGDDGRAVAAGNAAAAASRVKSRRK